MRRGARLALGWRLAGELCGPAFNWCVASRLVTSRLRGLACSRLRRMCPLLGVRYAKIREREPGHASNSAKFRKVSPA